MRVVNLTPHPIVVETPSGRFEIPPSGKIFRLAEDDKPAGTVTINETTVEVVERQFSVNLDNFLELTDPDCFCIVSLPALMALAQLVYQHPSIDINATVAAPDTGATAIRDEKGQIIAVRRFIVMWR